jgi:hypothetical protein
MSQSLNEILKEFLDEVDYTLGVETPGVGDRDFFERPYTQAKAEIKALFIELISDTFSPKNNGRYFGSLVKELKKRVEGL